MEGADGVRGVVQLVPGGQQTLLLGVEEEDEAHHHGERALVDLLGGYVPQQFAARLAVQPGHLRHQQGHRLAHLAAQGVGDLGLGVGGAGEQARRGVGRLALRVQGRADHTARGEQAGEGAGEDRLLGPQVRVEDGDRRRFLRAGVHQSPLAAVREQGERHLAGAAQFGRPVGEARLFSARAVEGALPVVRAEEQGARRQAAGPTGAEQHRVGRVRAGVQRVRDRRALAQAWRPPAQHVPQHERLPRGAQQRRVLLDLRPRLTELSPGLRRDRVQALRERPDQHRQRHERTVGPQQPQPVLVLLGGVGTEPFGGTFLVGRAAGGISGSPGG